MRSSLTVLNPFDALKNGCPVRWITPPLITEKAWWDGTSPNRPGVSIKALVEAGVTNITAEDAKKWDMGRKGGGAIIPYRRYDNRKPLIVEKTVKRKIDGKIFKFEVEIGRLRLEKPTEDQKYDQAYGTGSQIYVPPQFPTGHVESVVLVEGEFKALCLMENGIPAIGLSGISGWSLKQEDNSRPVLPDLLEVIRKTGAKKILFMGDNDVATNANFYREVELFVEHLTVKAGMNIPVFLPRWSLTMAKGVDDVRSLMSATEFATWWDEVSLKAIPVPVKTTAVQLARVLLESCGQYLATCIDPVEREETFVKLARTYLYHKKDQEFLDWLKSYASLCGFDSTLLESASDMEREKIKAKIEAKQNGKIFTPSAVFPRPQIPSGLPQSEVISEKMTEVRSRARSVLATVVVPAGLKVAKAARTTGRSLVAFAAQDIDPYQTLLGRRFLCREGGLIVIGPSGIGKSSSSIQQDMMWCQGKPAFGINPARPLRILGVQAENDDGDMTDTTRGVIAGLGLTLEELKTVHLNTNYHTIRTMSGKEFLIELECLLAAYQPDLLRLDPLQAFLGADPTDTEAVARFLRTGLSLLLEKYNCGTIIAHHTPKTNYRDTRMWKANDWMYSGAGCADMTNWARAIIVIDPTDTPKIFRFIAAKRDARMEWYDDQGRPVREKFFAHSKTPDEIFWEEVAADALPSEISSKTKVTEDVLLPYFKDDEPILKKELISKVNKETRIGLNKLDAFIDILLASKKLEVVNVARIGEAKRPWVYLKMATGSPLPVVANDGHEKPS